jgi:hypothetical protein
MTSCAMLLAAFFRGMQIGDVDKSKVYDVPAAILARMTLSSAQLLKRVPYDTEFGTKFGNEF